MFMFGYDFEEGGPASQWTENNNLNQNICFCGLLPPRELQKKLREMSLLLHPSLEEACPMAVLESMALELPVVAGMNSGGVPWVLDHGQAGFLTDMREPKSIAQSLLRSIKEVEVRQQRQKNASHRVLNLFSPELVAEQYEKMYERL
jgi:glycosyltransferase involved in cell wall biosynthesis